MNKDPYLKTKIIILLTGVFIALTVICLSIFRSDLFDNETENNKEEWNKKFVNNYFETGDIGHIDKDGFLIFKSKSDNKLNINGKTFYTEDIENMIKKFSNLEKLKIVQIQNKIYLISEKKIDEKKLYKIFKKNQINIIFDKILLNKIPITETGKIKFSDIKRLINEKK